MLKTRWLLSDGPLFRERVATLRRALGALAFLAALAAGASAEERARDAKGLLSAVVSPDDLPLDAEGRSALDGRQILGIVPRNVPPAEVDAASKELEAARSAIAAGQQADDMAVRADSPVEGRPARMDSGDRDPDRQRVTILPLPDAVR